MTSQEHFTRPGWTTSCAIPYYFSCQLMFLLVQQYRPLLDVRFSVQNAEIFTLTYGSMVRQLLTDLEDVSEVNKQLDRMYVNYIFNST